MFRLFTTISVLVCPVGHRLLRAPPDPPRPRDGVTPAPHSSPQCPRRERAPIPNNSASGGRGQVLSRGRLARSPGNEGIPGKGEFHHFWRHFPPGIFVRLSVFGFPFAWKAFFWGWNIVIPRRNFICIPVPGVFLAVRTHSSTYSTTAGGTWYNSLNGATCLPYGRPYHLISPLVCNRVPAPVFRPREACFGF